MARDARQPRWLSRVGLSHRERPSTECGVTSARQFVDTVKGAGSIGVQILSAVSIQMSLILPPTVCWIRHGGLGQTMIVVPFVWYMTFT